MSCELSGYHLSDEMTVRLTSLPRPLLHSVAAGGTCTDSRAGSLCFPAPGDLSPPPCHPQALLSWRGEQAECRPPAGAGEEAHTVCEPVGWIHRRESEGVLFASGAPSVLGWEACGRAGQGLVVCEGGARGRLLIAPLPRPLPSSLVDRLWRTYDCIAQGLCDCHLNKLPVPRSQSAFLAPSNEPGQVHCCPLSAPPRLPGCGVSRSWGVTARDGAGVRRAGLWTLVINHGETNRQPL